MILHNAARYRRNDLQGEGELSKGAGLRSMHMMCYTEDPNHNRAKQKVALERIGQCVLKTNYTTHCTAQRIALKTLSTQY